MYFISLLSAYRCLRGGPSCSGGLIRMQDANFVERVRAAIMFVCFG